MTRLAGSLYVAAAVLTAAVAAWPIYRSAAFVILVAVAAVLGAAVAWLCARFRLGGWATAGILFGVLVLAGVPLAVPARLNDLSQVVPGIGELLSGLIFGWKDLLTVELPVGAYRNLLVPALVVFLCGTTVALLLAWRTDAAGVWAVAVGIAMSGFGLLFGRTAVSAPLHLGPLTLAAPVETAVGIAGVLAGVLWLSWRARTEREGALRRAADVSGVRMRRTARAGARRVGLGAAMLALALVAGLLVPAAAASAPRAVLREAAGPRLDISRAVSPLADYRSLFTDDRLDTVVFEVTGAELPARVRLAVLDDYDGTVFRTATAPGSAPFVRVPSARGAGGDAVEMDVTLGAWDGIWVPSAGELAQIDFHGGRAAELSDGFYYSDVLSAAVEISPWRPGDRYTLRAAEPASRPLVEATAPGGVDVPAQLPASLRTWMERHQEGADGSALEGLVGLLRERGYLSHALQGEDDSAAWMRELGDYAFMPSAAGHSLARIDELFTALLEREDDPRAAASGNYVAAIGDDEQFSTAVALMAGALGFPARVVVGTRLEATDAGVSVCDGGRCAAGSISAWVEVRDATGEWIAIDVTPQYTTPPRREVTEQPDPTIGTAVQGVTADEVRPPAPSQEDTAAASEPPASVDLGWLWTSLRITGGVLGALLLVTGPFVAILVAKAWRRSRRKKAPTAAARVAGGWDEYLDAARDARKPLPRAATRVEIAEAVASPSAARIAATADEAVFSPREIAADEEARFWEIMDADRRTFAQGFWARVRAALSLRSFFPGRRRRRPTDTERGPVRMRTAKTA